MLRFTRVPEPVPPGFAESWLARYAAGQSDGSCAGFAAVDAEGRFVGLALAPTIDETAGEVELGYIVAPLTANASGHEHQIAMLWQAIEKLAARSRELPSTDCVPVDAHLTEHFDAERFNRLVK